MFQWWDRMQCVKNRRFLLTVFWFHYSSCCKDTICSIPAILKMFIKFVQIGIKTFIGLCLWLKCQYIKCDGNDDILKMVMTIGIGIRDCLNRQRLFENLIISPVKSYCELLSKYSFSFVVVYEQFWVIIWCIIDSNIEITASNLLQRCKALIGTFAKIRLLLRAVGR